MGSAVVAAAKRGRKGEKKGRVPPSTLFEYGPALAASVKPGLGAVKHAGLPPTSAMSSRVEVQARMRKPFLAWIRGNVVNGTLDTPVLCLTQLSAVTPLSSYHPTCLQTSPTPQTLMRHCLMMS